MNPAPPVMSTVAIPKAWLVLILGFPIHTIDERAKNKINETHRMHLGVIVVLISAFKRWRVRRAYNRQEWQRARRLGIAELEGPNHAFALDIVVRSMYNERLWEPLLRFVEEYPIVDQGIYVRKAQRKLDEQREKDEGIPEPNEKNPWNIDDLLSNWSQEGRRLWLRHPWGWTHWDMPEGYSLKDTHPALLHLALEVLLGPWVPETKRWDVEQRSPGANHSLSYSGGVDSTAASDERRPAVCAGELR